MKGAVMKMLTFLCLCSFIIHTSGGAGKREIPLFNQDDMDSLNRLLAQLRIVVEPYHKARVQNEQGLSPLTFDELQFDGVVALPQDKAPNDVLMLAIRSRNFAQIQEAANTEKQKVTLGYVYFLRRQRIWDSSVAYNHEIGGPQNPEKAKLYVSTILMLDRKRIEQMKVESKEQK